MDFFSALLSSPKRDDAVWVIFYHRTKSFHFILFRESQLTEVLAGKYMRDSSSARSSVSIISDKDTRF